MARIRTIKPSFFTDPDIAALPLSARLTFIGLWTHVDDAGRALDDPRLVKAAIWPIDDRQTVKKVDTDLQLLADQGQIERYEVDGRHYLRVCNWHHQYINRPQPSSVPPSPAEPPPSTDRSGRTHGAGTDRSRQEGKGTEWNGTGNGKRNGSTSRPTSDSRPARPAVSDETKIEELSPAQEQFATRMAELIKANGGRVTDERFTIARWAVGAGRNQLDFRYADEALGGAAVRNGRPKSPRYFVPLLIEAAERAGIELAPYPGAR